MKENFFCIADNPKDYYACFMRGLKKRNPGQEEFHQTVGEVAHCLIPFLFDNKKYIKEKILERMVEPDRVISFRVCWEDDNGDVRANRGFRVQFNNSIGPYKGGLRFHPSVNEGILKFLGFEQIFKNSLTGQAIGGAKGGSNFNPKGKSKREIMRFCHAFMTQLHPYIHEDKDVPAGDIGVGEREISYMFGQYKRITNRFAGILTGKGIEYGGSLIRIEATGHGLVYIAAHALERQLEGLKDKKCLVSGAGNVAQHAAEMLIEKGAKIVAMSDSKGVLTCKGCINKELLNKIKALKKEGKSLSELDGEKGLEFIEDKSIWSIPCDYAFPCATENELEIEDAKTLVENGCKGIFEGANMPLTSGAVKYVQNNDTLYIPGKAANAGGVAISAMEMSQNRMRLSWTSKEVDQKLQETMKSIHQRCVEYGKNGDKIDYIKGANIAGFIKVADAMLAYGIH